MERKSHSFSFDVDNFEGEMMTVFMDSEFGGPAPRFTSIYVHMQCERTPRECALRMLSVFWLEYFWFSYVPF